MQAETISELRAARRLAMREAIQAKAGWPVPFGLLVIPVDFADARFDPDFDPIKELLPRLSAGTAGSLDHYFDVASRGRTRLVIRLAPVVSLPGSRSDYYGVVRLRTMALQAFERVSAMGIDFSSMDLDNDGELDGAFLLHAGIGYENDPLGLIIPLQDFIDDPVVQRGILARSYAVASARSTLGVWAHEVGHLLGLEDRYDAFFPSSSAVPPAGGLVRFSLMASGWLGTGQGEDPALPDGYSSLLLGWVDLGSQPGPSTVVRLDYDDGPGREFFLVEQRFPELTAPYDAGLPSQRLIMLHIDETLSEGQASSLDWSERHLRANLVQADGSDSVARGLSQGQLTDLFPSDGIWQAFNDQTIPSSRAFHGQLTGVDATVAVVDQQVQFTCQTVARAFDLRLEFAESAGTITPRIMARIMAPQAAPASLHVTISCLEPAWGQFTGGNTLAARLLRVEPGMHAWADYVDQGLEAWLPAEDVPADAVTVFHATLNGNEAGFEQLAWRWDTAAAPLDIASAWPGSWRAHYPTGDSGTLWHRWLTGPSDEGLMLACTGAQETTADRWPQVRYWNNAHAVLQSPLLGSSVQWLEMTHAVNLEVWYPGHAVDGVVLSWLHANGRVSVPAEPADGWLGRIWTKARHPLAGRPSFAVQDMLLEPGARPLWRREVLPLPSPEDHGPGPWRLQFELASNAQWGGRGWLVRDVQGHLTEPPHSAFPVSVTGTHLSWSWNQDSAVDVFRIESSTDGGLTWSLDQEIGTAGSHVGQWPTDHWTVMPGQRILLRMLAQLGDDHVVSRAVPLMTGRMLSLGPAFPNPARQMTHLTVDGAGDTNATLGLYDLRGRLVRRWSYDGAPQLYAWDGTDADGRSVPAGVYLFRLYAHQETLTRKVTWLP